jgi:hypothetical protein
MYSMEKMEKVEKACKKTTFGTEGPTKMDVHIKRRLEKMKIKNPKMYADMVRVAELTEKNNGRIPPLSQEKKT